MKLRSTCSPNCSSFDEGKDVQFVCTTTVAKIKKNKMNIIISPQIYMFESSPI